MMRRTPFKRTAIRVAPVQDRDQSLLDRAARMAAQACPRAAVVANAAGLTVPVHKDKPVRSEAYRRAVATLPCVICKVAGYSQAAHANTGKGMGLKACDLTLFPACCDRPGVRGCHSQLDQGALFSKAVRRELEPIWAADTRRKIQAMGLWPQNLPMPTDSQRTVA